MLIVLTVILIESFFISVHGIAVQWPCNCYTLYTTVNNCMKERDLGYNHLKRVEKRNRKVKERENLLIIHLYPLTLLYSKNDFVKITMIILSENSVVLLKLVIQNATYNGCIIIYLRIYNNWMNFTLYNI